MQFHKITIRGLILTYFIVVAGIFIAPERISAAEISTTSFCQLTISEMEQQISNYQELITLATQYEDDPETLALQEEALRIQFDREKEARYSSYGITAQEFALYMGKHAAEVNDYLEEHPDVKQQLDFLTIELGALAEEHSALKEKSDQEPSPPLQ